MSLVSNGLLVLLQMYEEITLNLVQKQVPDADESTCNLIETL